MDKSDGLLAHLNLKKWDTPSLPRSNSAPLLSLSAETQFGFNLHQDASGRLSAFVSESTTSDGLMQLLAFLPDDAEVFECLSQQITEKHFYIQQGVSLSSGNEISAFFNNMMEASIKAGATDLHIEESENRKQVLVRINKTLTNFARFSDFPSGLRIKLKLLAGMNISEKRRPQDGSMRYFSANGQKYDLRVSTMPGLFQEKIVVRILPSADQMRKLHELGLSQPVLNRILSYAAGESGMLVVGGPTGSGKTTLLYAVLKILIERRLNIISVEEPVEYRIAGVTQINVNEKAGLGYNDVLRYILRQDPDVILVGEIRDEETASFAVQAAHTGHLVLTTVHSENPMLTIARLANLGVSLHDIYASLRLVVSQRLHAVSCSCGGDPDCKKCYGSGASGVVPVNGFLEVNHQKTSLSAFIEAVENTDSALLGKGQSGSMQSDMALKKKKYDIQSG